MDLTPIIDRLATQLECPVAGGAQLAAVPQIARTPAIWILPAAETWAANQCIGGVYQTVTVSLDVVYAIRDVSDPRGESALGALEDLREQVMALLIGWVPADEHAPLEIRRGDLISLADGILWWRDRLETTRNRRFETSC